MMNELNNDKNWNVIDNKQDQFLTNYTVNHIGVYCITFENRFCTYIYICKYTDHEAIQ